MTSFLEEMLTCFAGGWPYRQTYFAWDWRGGFRLVDCWGKWSSDQKRKHTLALIYAMRSRAETACTNKNPLPLQGGLQHLYTTAINIWHITAAPTPAIAIVSANNCGNSDRSRIVRGMIRSCPAAKQDQQQQGHQYLLWKQSALILYIRTCDAADLWQASRYRHKPSSFWAFSCSQEPRGS